MADYTTDTKPRVLRKGDTVTQTLVTKRGAQTLTITTPCSCAVSYRLHLDEVDWHLGSRRPMTVTCGKRRVGRGNQRGQEGCAWLYEVAFRRETVAQLTATWKV